MKLMALTLALSMVSALPALCESASVVGGEHGDFTRLVVEAGNADGWKFGRAADGYELQLPRAITAYDVTKAFDRIAKKRIAALWQDPDTGRLRFSLACACNAIAFEFRPGTVVIDIREGSPAEGSSFEMPLDPAEEAPPSEVASEVPPSTPDEAKPSYDWVAVLRQQESEPAKDVLPLPLNLPTGDVSLDPLRDALLAQISKGAAQGVVDVTDALPDAAPGEASDEENLWSRISVGEMPGLAAGEPEDAPAIAGDGRICLTDGDLDVSSWGLPGPVVTQIGLARTGIVGEFDAPSEEAVLRAARFHIFLGFGAEARQYLGLLPPDNATAPPILNAMARIMDEEVASPNPFAGMEACDTAAALWANLANGPTVPLLPNTNASAVGRSLSAMPTHLRNHLGPALVDKFLAEGDQETARLLRDAILRLPVEGDPETALMDAKYQLADGNDQGAAQLAEDVIAEGGPETPEAAITLVEATFRSDRMIEPDLPSALEIFLRDAKGTAGEAKLLRAAALAHAMTGDFETALRLPVADAETFSDLWSLAADTAADDVFLAYAAEMARNRPDIRDEVAAAVAERLLVFGFADLALGWLEPVAATTGPDLRLLAGEAFVSVRDARAALAVLEGMTEPEAAALRAIAELQLGALQTVAETLIASGDKEGGERAAVWTKDWSFIREAGPEVWKDAVDLLDPPAADSTARDGSIAKGKALADESLAARAALEALLAKAPEAAVSQ